MHIYRYTRINHYIYNYILVFRLADRAEKKNRGVWGAARPPVYEKKHIYRYTRIFNYIYGYILVFEPADRAEKKQGGLGGGTPPSIRKNEVLSLYSYT